MAQKKGATTDTDDKAEEKAVQSEQAEQEKSEQTESVYTIEELSANANHLFGVRTECVVAALKAAGINECTVSKTREIVKEFMGKEIQ